MREGIEVGSGRWKERGDGQHHGLSLNGGGRGRDLGCRRDDVVDIYIGHDSRARLPKVVSGGDGREMGGIVISHCTKYIQVKYLKVNERLASGTCTMVRR